MMFFSNKKEISKFVEDVDGARYDGNWNQVIQLLKVPTSTSADDSVDSSSCFIKTVQADVAMHTQPIQLLEAKNILDDILKNEEKEDSHSSLSPYVEDALVLRAMLSLTKAIDSTYYPSHISHSPPLRDLNRVDWSRYISLSHHISSESSSVIGKLSPYRWILFARGLMLRARLLEREVKEGKEDKGQLWHNILDAYSQLMTNAYNMLFMISNDATATMGRKAGKRKVTEQHDRRFRKYLLFFLERAFVGKLRAHIQLKSVYQCVRVTRRLLLDESLHGNRRSSDNKITATDDGAEFYLARAMLFRYYGLFLGLCCCSTDYAIPEVRSFGSTFLPSNESEEALLLLLLDYYNYYGKSSSITPQLPFVASILESNLILKSSTKNDDEKENNKTEKKDFLYESNCVDPLREVLDDHDVVFRALVCILSRSKHNSAALVEICQHKIENRSTQMLHSSSKVLFWWALAILSLSNHVYEQSILALKRVCARRQQISLPLSSHSDAHMIPSTEQITAHLFSVKELMSCWHTRYSEAREHADHAKKLASLLPKEHPRHMFFIVLTHAVYGICCSRYSHELARRPCAAVERNKLQEEAIINLEIAHQRGGKFNLKYALQLAACYADVRRLDDAKTLVSEVLKVQPIGFSVNDETSDRQYHIDNAWYLLALLFSAEKKNKKALQTCDTGLATNPPSIHATYLLLLKAKLATVLNKHDVAIECFVKLVEKHCNNIRISFMVSTDGTPSHPFLEFITKEEDEEEEMGQNNTVAREKSVAGNINNFQTSQSRSASPYYLQYYVMLALADFLSTRNETLSDAISCLNYLLDLINSRENSISVGMAPGMCLGNAVLWISDAYCALGKTMTCYGSCDEAQTMQQVSLSSLSYPLPLGITARQYWELALSLNPLHVESLVSLASFEIYHNKNYSLANTYISTAISVDDKSHEALQLLGLVLQERGELDQAAKLFISALNLEKTAPILPFSFFLRDL